MQNRFLAGLLYGIVLGDLGSLAIYGMTYHPSPIVIQPLVTQPTPAVPPKISPRATPHQFNGETYYVVPLS